MIQFRAGHVDDVLVVAGKLLHIGGFLEKVHFFLRNAPQLVNDHIQIHQIANFSDWRNQFDSALHQSDIARHDIIYALSLDLDNYVLAGKELCLMDLGNRSGTERLLFNGCKNILPPAAI